MSDITEDKLELLAIEWFKKLGYDYLLGYDIAPNGKRPLRKTYEDVLLENRLETALVKLNPSIPFEAIADVVYRLKNPQKTNLVQNNQEFHKMLLQGVSVEVKKDDGADIEIVKLIDFHNIENNDFLVVNQYTIKGKEERRPDMIVFINGLPISVIELKNPVGKNATIEEAFNQIKTYKNEIEDLFVYNESVIISDGINARIASLTADREWYMYWRTIENENDKPKLELELEIMIKGFFNKELLLDYLQNFVLFEDNGKNLIKKIAGYHQFHAAREAVSSILSAKFNKTRKGGVVWHTQGSGKSISMVCLASKLTKQTEKLRKSISVDWQKRESVRAKMRNIIRIILKRYKYPANQAPDAIELVMKQTEVLSNEWSK